MLLERLKFLQTSSNGTMYRYRMLHTPWNDLRALQHAKSNGTTQCWPATWTTGTIYLSIEEALKNAVVSIQDVTPYRLVGSITEGYNSHDTAGCLVP